MLEGVQEFLTLKQTTPLEIGSKCIISAYNQNHIIRELCTWDFSWQGQKLMSILMASVMSVHFSMQEEDILEHINASCQLYLL